MKKSIYIYMLIMLILFICSHSFAHPGRTDSKGGHYDRYTGEYHYHDGRYAGREQSGSSSSSPTLPPVKKSPPPTPTPIPTKTPTYKPEPVTTPSPTPAEEQNEDAIFKELTIVPFKIVFILFCVALIIITLCSIVLIVLKIKYKYFAYDSWTVKVFILQTNKKITEKNFMVRQINIPYKKYLDENGFLYGYIGIKQGQKTIIIIDKETWLSLTKDITTRT